MIKIDWARFLYCHGIFGYCVHYDTDTGIEAIAWNFILISPRRRTVLQLCKWKTMWHPIIQQGPNFGV